MYGRRIDVVRTSYGRDVDVWKSYGRPSSTLYGRRIDVVWTMDVVWTVRRHRMDVVSTYKWTSYGRHGRNGCGRRIDVVWTMDVTWTLYGRYIDVMDVMILRNGSELARNFATMSCYVYLRRRLATSITYDAYELNALGLAYIYRNIVSDPFKFGMLKLKLKPRYLV